MRPAKSTVPKSTNPTVPIKSGKTTPATAIRPAANSTPVSSDSKQKQEIELLKKLNSELLQRLKSVEDELQNTKQLLSLSPHTERSPSVPESTPPVHTPTDTIPVPPTTSPTSTPPVYTRTIHCEPQLLVYGDSMVRGFGEILQELLPEYSVHCYTSPGAPISFAIKNLPQHAGTLTKEDVVFILAGSNNVPHLTPVCMEKEFQELRNLCHSTNVVFSSVPFKFHDKKPNGNIFASNQFILSRSRAYKFYYFECNYFLSRSMYTGHGLHFNLSGKKFYCEQLATALLSLSCNTTTSYGFLLPNHPNLGSNVGLIIDITCPLLQDTVFDLTDSLLSENSSFFLEQL